MAYDLGVLSEERDYMAAAGGPSALFADRGSSQAMAAAVLAERKYGKASDRNQALRHAQELQLPCRRRKVNVVIKSSCHPSAQGQAQDVSEESGRTIGERGRVRIEWLNREGA
jgi:hypothetical protein